MSEADLRNIPDGGHLAEPPIIDSLIRDESRGEWAISLVPEEKVSPREKEQVAVSFDSVEGKRIALRVRRLESLLNRSPIDRIFHAGDGNFSFQTRAGEVVHLADPHGRIDLSVPVPARRDRTGRYGDDGAAHLPRRVRLGDVSRIKPAWLTV